MIMPLEIIITMFPFDMFQSFPRYIAAILRVWSAGLSLLLGTCTREPNYSRLELATVIDRFIETRHIVTSFSKVNDIFPVKGSG